MSAIAIDRSQWLGASDAAAVLGISPWCTKLELYEQKLGLAEKPVESWPMRRGNALEAHVALEYSRLTGRETRVVDQPLVHPDHAFLVGHLDREVVTPEGEPRRILEVKTTTRREGWGDTETDDIPTHYLCQCHVYLALSGAAVCDVVLDTGVEVRVYEVHRDEALEAEIIARMVAFWNDNVLARVPPSPTTSAEASRAWTAIAGKSINGSPQLLRDVEELRKIKDQQKDLDERREAVELRIKITLGDSESAHDEHGVTFVTLKTQTSNRLDVTALKQDAPELYSQFLKSSETRVLRTPHPKK